MSRIRVVVVDDSALVRSLLAEIINRQADMQCVGSAADPYAAREVIRELNPDVITLDIEMPRMDGLEFLSRLMRLRPMPVVMVSTLTERGAEATFRALELGAVTLLREVHKVPVIVDPSHAAGRKDLIPRLGLAALAAGAHGLIVEAHPDPTVACSDAAQQLTQAELEAASASLLYFFTISIHLSKLAVGYAMDGVKR
jgi:two-component system chemotaxis response regulator CheB